MKRLLQIGLLVAGSVTAAYAGGVARGGGAAGASQRQQGYLGVDVRDVHEEQVSSLRLKDARGAQIVQVDHDGPAGKVGLRAHDVVLQLNGQTILGEEQLRRLLREMAPGRTVTMLISRDGQQMTITTAMSTRELVERQAWEQHMSVQEPAAVTGGADGVSDNFFSSSSANAPTPPSTPASRGFLGTILMSPAYTGAMLEMISPQLADFFGAPNGQGLLVRSVEAKSPAAIAGLKAGDVVLRANALPLKKTTDWGKLMEHNLGRAVPIVVLRDKKEQTLTLVPDAKRRSSLNQPFPSLDHTELASRAAL